VSRWRKVHLNGSAVASEEATVSRQVGGDRGSSRLSLALLGHRHVRGGGCSGARRPDWRQLAAPHGEETQIDTTVSEFGARGPVRTVKGLWHTNPACRHFPIEVPSRHPRWPFRLDPLGPPTRSDPMEDLSRQPLGCGPRGRRNQDPRVCRAQQALARASLLEIGTRTVTVGAGSQG